MNHLIYTLLTNQPAPAGTTAGQLARAEQEIGWARQHGVRLLTRDDAEYPQRLLRTPEAPDVLFVSGPADLNAVHAVSIVGTRRITPYGRPVPAHLP